MSFSIDIINALLIATLAANTVYGLIVYFRNRSSLTNKWFFALTLAVSLWIISMLSYRGFSDYGIVIYSCRILYASSAIIILVLIYFDRIFLDESYKFSWIEKIALPLITAAVVLMSIIPQVLIRGIVHVPKGETIIVYNNWLHLVFALYITGFFTIAHTILYKKCRKAEGIAKKQIAGVIIGTAIGSSIGVVSNLILPYFGIFTVNWLGQVGTLGMIIPIFYSIFKYRLFNVQVITTEMLMLVLWFILLARTVFSFNKAELASNMLVLTLSTVIGLILIRSVRGEVELKEKLERSNEQLEELDELKSKFISLATHHIASPLTAIKGYVSLLQEGEYDHKPEEAKKTLKTLSRLVNNLVNIIRDFLDVTSLEREEVKCWLRDVDVRDLVEQTVSEYEPQAERAGLTISFSAVDGKDYVVQADHEKIRRAVGNIIENSIRYTSEGSIGVSVSAKDSKIHINISDTGSRNLPNISEKLFNKFTTSGSNDEANIIGNGLGLYVAKQLIEAHHGTIRIEPVQGAGWRFIIDLPVEQASAASRDNTERKEGIAV